MKREDCVRSHTLNYFLSAMTRRALRIHSRRFKPWSRSLYVALLLCWMVPLSWATDARYPFDSLKQQAQFQSLLHDLRCPVCQNQDLADSNAGVASDLRQEVYRRGLAHQSDYEIIHYLTARYGDFILMTPPLEITTVILWFGPLVLLGIGLIFFVQKCIRRRPYE